MKIERTEISPKLNSYVAALTREEPFFQSPFHYHPELELVYIKESYGKRIVGNALEPFNAGDMVFLGPDLPHVWLNDEAFYRGNSRLKARAFVLYFNKDIFSPLFYNLKESLKINRLFEKASRGLLITGSTNKSIAAKLEKLVKKKDFEIIVGLMEILSELAGNSKDISYINSEAYAPASEKFNKDRITDVLNYLKLNYREDITLTEISKVANLTPQSFCRLFKSRVKKHFVEYLNEVRIANACKMLQETELSISEIAYDCGYKTVSNFNKQFKKIAGTTPKDYKNLQIEQ